MQFLTFQRAALRRARRRMTHTHTNIFSYLEKHTNQRREFWELLAGGERVEE
jgi:hypothetical protein